jgi:hypothetical protein
VKHSVVMGEQMGDPYVRFARKALLSTWLRILSWLFLVFLLAPVLLLLGVLGAENFTTNAYGLSYRGPPLATLGLLLDAVLFLHGVAAYGLLWGRQWGPTAAIGTCGLGLTISLWTFVEGGFSDIGAAPFILAFVLVALARLRRRWTRCPVETSR